MFQFLKNIGREIIKKGSKFPKRHYTCSKCGEEWITRHYDVSGAGVPTSRCNSCGGMKLFGEIVEDSE